MAYMNAKLPDQVYRRIFDKLDNNGDGYILLRDIKGRKRGVPNDIPDDVREKLFAKADRDADGRLDYNEFVQLLSSPNLPPTFRRWLYNYAKSYSTYVVAPREFAPTDEIDGRVYMEEANCFPPPITIFFLSIIEIIVFIYYGVTMGNVTASGPVPFESPLIYDPYKRYEAWRYISYMLIHAGWMHITFNVLVQLLLGIPLEMVHKWWRVLLVYLAGVLAGSLGTSISDPNVYLAGASGGVYAIITAHLATLILNWKEMKFAIIQLIAFIVLMGTDISVAVYNRYSASTTDRTGYAAHLAGAVAGLLIGLGVLRNLEVRQWEKRLWWVSMIIYVVLMLIAIIWNAAFPEYFPESRYD